MGSLRELTVTEVPDIQVGNCVSYIPEDLLLLDDQFQLAEVAAQVKRTAVMNAMVNSGLLPLTASAAVQTFQHFHDYGCWLLKQHTRLYELHLSTVKRAIAMSWRRQQLPKLQVPNDINKRLTRLRAPGCSRDMIPLAVPLADGMQWCVDHIMHDYRVPRDDPNDTPDLSSQFQDFQEVYSSRPFPVLLQHIVSCELFLARARFGGPPGLTSLLHNLSSLKHLQVTLPTASTAAVAAAVVEHSKIQSLELTYCNYYPTGEPDPTESPSDLLLPLTAAAGGPGTTLKKLELDEGFMGAAVLVHEALNNVRDSTSSRSQWHCTLRQFDGLTELVLCSDPRTLFEISATSLPAGLRVLNCRWINIVGEVTETVHNVAKGTMSSVPFLKRLELRYSQLSSPGVLASHQLHQLTLVKSTFPGGCGAAATAWPKVKKLVWVWESPAVLGRWKIATAGSADEEYSEVQINDDHLDDIGGPAVTCCYNCDQVFEDQIVAVIRSKFKCVRSISAKALDSDRGL